jgi:hypothetical protein
VALAPDRLTIELCSSVISTAEICAAAYMPIKMVNLGASMHLRYLGIERNPSDLKLAAKPG